MIPHLMMKNMMCIVVVALCNQPEAFASDLGDDQLCYLYLISNLQVHRYSIQYIAQCPWSDFTDCCCDNN